MRLELNPGYDPHRFQVRAHRLGHRFVAATAGVRGGKTRWGAAEFVRRIARDMRDKAGRRVVGTGRRRRARLHYWVVSPTSDLLKEPIRYLFESIPSAWIERFYHDDNSLWLKGDILIEFKSADRPETLVSVGLDGIWIDEGPRLKADAWRGQLRSRLTDQNGWCIATGSPMGRNWFYTDFVLRAQADPEHYAAVSWRTVDNDKIANIREEAESAKRDLPARYYKRDYEASFDAFVGLVFEEWDERVHVVTPEQLRFEYGYDIIGEAQNPHGRRPFKRVIAGQDWGFTKPGALVVVGEISTDDYLVLDESYAPGRIVFDRALREGTWVAEAIRLRNQWGISQIMCDNAEPRSIFDYQRAGLPALPADKDVATGLRKVNELFHPVERPGRPSRPRIRILANCKNLIREAQNYQWAQVKGRDDYAEYPADGQDDHACDALRYAVIELVQFEALTQAPPASPFARYAYGGGRPPG